MFSKFYFDFNPCSIFIPPDSLIYMGKIVVDQSKEIISPTNGKESTMRDKIDDVLFVLKEIFNEIKGSIGNIKATEIRRKAVKSVARTELAKKSRFKDFDSAKKSIHDACVRRLRIDRVGEFDELIELCINQNSSQLQDILIKHATNKVQRSMISDFFKEINR